MKVVIKPSDLNHNYAKNNDHRTKPIFRGVPDSTYFDRGDLYEVITMFVAVMEALHTADRRVLGQLENLLLSDVPPFLKTREDVFHFLLARMRESLEDQGGVLMQ